MHALPRIFWDSTHYAKCWRLPQPARTTCVRIATFLLDARPVLDLGCGEATLTHKHSGLFIDIEPRAQRPDALQLDIRSVDAYRDRIVPGSVACLIDVLEHLTRADALELLATLSPLVLGFLVFAPIGALSLSDVPSPHSHRSTWEPFEFLHAGWNVIELPTFHRYDDGYIHGAFFAWTGLGLTALDAQRHCL